MQPTTEHFIKNIDAWVKYFKPKIDQIPDIKKRLEETVDNTDHNYELIYELKDQIEELKQEINALKLIQIIAFKKNKELEKLE